MHRITVKRSTFKLLGMVQQIWETCPTCGGKERHYPLIWQNGADCPNQDCKNQLPGKYLFDEAWARKQYHTQSIHGLMGSIFLCIK